ncbi:MAG: hypothetical protein HRT47_01150 [Candidatus Caenarcaniphilales bacterium]|nr:hypothetical protein [Candidatus Caenarcaniphilales bacterium]
MSSFEITAGLKNANSLESVSGAKQKPLSLKSLNQKNGFKLQGVDFSEKFTDSPEKLAKALKTIDSIGVKLNEINSFIEDAKYGNYTNNQKLEKEEEFLKVIKDVKELKNTDEFKSIQNQLRKSGINLNIGSQKVDNFLNHFFDTGLDESQPDLTGIYDQVSSLNRLNANNFTVVGEYLVTELSSVDESSAGVLEGIALLSNENSNVENSMNLDSVSESFKAFPARSYSSDNNQVLVALDGIQTSETVEPNLKAAYLFDAETHNQVSSFSHPDFEVNMTFKGGEIKDDNVYIHSEGAEYLFKTDGEFVNKFKTENSQKLNESRIVNGDLYAIGPASEKKDGRIVGALYKFDIESGKQTAEIPSPGSSGNGTFGVNMESLGDKLFITESDIIKKDGGHITKGRVHVYDSSTGSFEGEINPKNDIKGAGLFGESMAVSDTFVAVTAKSSSATGTENTSIHVFDSRLGTQIHKITPQYYGTELSGNIEISDDKLLISSQDKAGRSNIYEFDLSTREKNLDKFMSMIGDDARVIDAIKTNIVANRLSDMNGTTTYEGREGKESTYTGRERLSTGKAESLYNGRAGKESTYSGRVGKESTFNGREGNTYEGRENISSGKAESLYTGREGKESTYTGRKGNTYEGRESKAYKGREGNIYEGRELEAHINLEDGNPKDISNKKDSTGKNFFQAREGAVLEKSDSELTDAAKNVVFKDHSVTNEKVVKSENVDSKFSDNNKAVKHRSNGNNIEEGNNNELNDENIETTQTFNSKPTKGNDDKVQTNQKATSQIDNEKNLINNFVSNIEFQASVAASQTSHKIRTSIQVNESKTFKAQANISPTAAMDMLP